MLSYKRKDFQIIIAYFFKAFRNETVENFETSIRNSQVLRNLGKFLENLSKKFRNVFENY